MYGDNCGKNVMERYENGKSGNREGHPAKSAFIRKKKTASGVVIGNKYRILEPLGKGGFGNVYKVKDEHIDKFYAMKIQPLQSATDFDKEIGILKELEHFGLPSLHDVLTDSEYSYIVMEIASGVTLEEYVRKRGKLSLREARRIAGEVCEIVSYLHSQPVPIIHGDLKPENIMIDDSRVCLIDFGCALRAYCEEKTVFGTPGFAAPELGEGEITTRSDIYSLGKVMFYMLTGRSGETTEYCCLHKTLRTYGVPRRMRRMIQKCLQPQLELRYPSATELYEALADVRNVGRHLPGITASYIAMILRIIGFAMLLYCLLLYKYGGYYSVEAVWCAGYVKELFVISLLVILSGIPWAWIATAHYKTAILECECNILVTEGNNEFYF